MKTEEKILKKILKKIEFHDGTDYIGIDLEKSLNKPMIEIQGIENKDFFEILKIAIRETRANDKKKFDEVWK